MAMEVAFRGATVFFKAQFFDADGNAAAPATVNLSINFVQNGQRQTAVHAMNLNLYTDKFEYDWDSRGVTPGEVTWSVATGVPLPLYVDDGCFELKANSANLDE